MGEAAVVLLSAVLVNNFVLTKFLGICPFLGVSGKVETAVGMSFAVMFVMTLAATVSWLVQQYLLVPFHLLYLQTIFFILIIAALVQFIEMMIHKTSPVLYQALGIFLPLITTNCAVLGVALLNVQKKQTFLTSALYGFGAAAHIIAQLARWQGRTIFAFTRPGDADGQAFARTLGAAWAGDSTSTPPDQMDAAIIFAPVGALVPEALRHTAKGGRVVCAGIHMSDIPAFPYELLWGERSLRSVANLTRADGEAFLALAAQVPVRTTVEVFPLREANDALDAVRSGRVHGAAVLDCSA